MPDKAIINKTNLEEFGKNGYMMYRIPGIIVSSRNTVLSYYEARMGKGDWTKQDIYLQRSEDNGETWSERKLLVQGNESETLHNAVMVVDNQNDLIHFLWHKNYDQCFYQRSTDDGITWSEPKEITYVFERFRQEYDWNVIAVGPGHGICLKNGRLFIPAWLSNGGQIHRPSVLSCIYSDDQGETWERGEIIWADDEFINPNETTAVQLEDGRVLMNIRHESNLHRRAYSISNDGATGWSKPEYDMDLIDPICFGSLIRFAEKEEDGYSGILFSNCAYEDLEGARLKAEGKVSFWSSDARRNLTIKLSTDECKTWQYAKLLEEQAGYSDIAVSRDKRYIYCLYEREWVDGSCTNTKYMAVARFNLSWVKGE